MKILATVILAIGALGSFLLGLNLLQENDILEANRKKLLEEGVVTEASFVRKKRKIPAQTEGYARRVRSTYSYTITYRFDARSHSKGSLSLDKFFRGEELDLDLTIDYRYVTVFVGKKAFREATYGKSTVKVMYLKDNPEIHEVLLSDGKFKSNHKLYYAIGLLVLSLLFIKTLHQFVTTGKTW